MTSYYVRLDGETGFERRLDEPSLDDARNEAIRVLGEHLQSNPEYAYERHWRVDLLDQSKRLLLHVIVATVDAAKPLNWSSYDDQITV